MGYLVELLRNPARRISALALIGGPAAMPAVLDQGDHHEVLDEQARAAYAERLMDLTTELDQAGRRHAVPSPIPLRAVVIRLGAG
jgi:hypothetical protein